jgi:hypothetical protein
MRSVVREFRSCVLAGGILASAGLARPALAVDAEGCVPAYEQAQVLRSRGKFRGAREQLLICVQDGCPKFIATDCAHWLSEVDASTPTVVISARDENGRELTGVHVIADGDPFLDGLDGKAVAIDPGLHVLQFERPSSKPVERQYVIHQGERNRSIAVELRGEADGPTVRRTSPTSTAVPPSAAPPDSGGGSARVTWGALAGALGIAGIAGFAYFGLSGHADVEQMRSRCAPSCSDSDIASARTKLLIGDASLGVGLASLGLATWLLFGKNRRSEPRPTAHFEIGPIAHGGAAELAVTFR